VSREENFLVPGIYNVRAEQLGFEVVSREDVQLQVGAVGRIDFKVEVGGVTEAVKVSGTAALLATEGMAVGTVIENHRNGAQMGDLFMSLIHTCWDELLAREWRFAHRRG
jgi:hypothetical protein